ncbi:MAG: LD-carboxypeptidase [Bacteroidia bacterium]|jgi:muramoyltetrapeptide carboxypeptidase|nr:LD-carboxypeptidase [Bacteroidia bacterium]
MGIVKFKPLKSGDTVSIIAPARAVSAEEMAPMVQWLQSKGLHVAFGQHLYGRNNQFSGTDAERAADFIAAWTDPRIAAVVCARGGYGCMRFLDFVDEEIIKQGFGKILLGYSDITTLHLSLAKWGIETVHGPMAINLFNPNTDVEDNFLQLEKLLFTGGVNYDLEHCEIIHKNVFEGELIGGNISLIYASLGTAEAPTTQNKILFLEDLDEYLYHLDRMLVSMDRSGIFKQLSGLVIGDLLDMKDNAIPFGQNAKEIIINHTAKYGFPIIFDFPAGHGFKNYSMKMNAFTTFDGRYFNQPL